MFFVRMLSRICIIINILKLINYYITLSKEKIAMQMWTLPVLFTNTFKPSLCFNKLLFYYFLNIKIDKGFTMRPKIWMFLLILL